MQRHRISTNIGLDQKVVLELKQDYDLLEILSLKFTQQDVYTSLCSTYGVVCGRVTANNGFGVPNAKVSIFVPVESLDLDDPVISALYPYQLTSDRNNDNYRYNLLPARKQHGGHVPTGTFPDQTDVLNREEVLEVYEKYYSFTVKTNNSGDFMIWGVPLGSQVIHVDLDLSDMGCFSLRPYDFIRKGVGEAEFDRFYNFKSSSDIDGLPQIVSFEKTIEVFPFWGNEDLCEIGITRTDFDLSERNIFIEPIALVLASAFTDDNSKAIKRNGKITRGTGYKCNLQTSEGTVECVRYTGGMVYSRDNTKLYPELEYYELKEGIDSDGAVMAVLPMNMEYVYTNEFGEEEITNDPNKGIPTTSIARFRFGLTNDNPKITVANYLVPNIREFTPDAINGSNSRYENEASLVATYTFSNIFENYITPNPPTGTTVLSNTNYNSTAKQHKEDLILGVNNNNVPEDYFYKFTYGKVFTVSSFQGTYFEGTNFSASKDAFLGIKEIRPNVESDCAGKTNYFPTNFGYRNRVKFNVLISSFVLAIQFILLIIQVKVAEIIGRFFYTLYNAFWSIRIIGTRPFGTISELFKDQAYSIQSKYTQQLPLSIYPDCDECSTDTDNIAADFSGGNTYCRVAEVKTKILQPTGANYDVFLLVYDDFTTSGTSYQNQTTDVSYLPEFSDEYAKDSEGLCSGTTYVDYSGLTNLQNLTTTVPNSANTSRYYVEIYPYISSGNTGNTFTPFVGFFNDLGDLQSVKFYRDPAADHIQIKFTKETWMELTSTDASTEQYQNTYAIVRIYDRSIQKTDASAISGYTFETGCSKYDTPYNEQILTNYFWTKIGSYGDLNDPEMITNPYTYGDGSIESLTIPVTPGNWQLMASIITPSNAERLPRIVNYTYIPDKKYDRRTRSGYSEIRDGVFTIIPVIHGNSSNAKAITEWYRRKRIGLFLCAGVINYTFIDNWLNGVLYFFKFDKKLRFNNPSTLDLNYRSTKYPRELIFYNLLENKFYYRGTPYNYSTQKYIGQDVTSSGIRSILHPTTFYDAGVRDEFLKEICTDPRIDPNCSVVRDIGGSSYQDPANIIEYAVNYRLDVTNGKTNIDDFFNDDVLSSKVNSLDGDLMQLFSINSEAGIEAFDLDSPQYYMYNGDLLDPENPGYMSYFTSGTTIFGPTPIDLKYDDNGQFVRSCLNYRLGDFSQKVPYYLWDKKGQGFGPYNSNQDKQFWDKTEIASGRLQRIYSISATTATTTNYNFSDGEEEYLLPPMTITHNTFALTGNTTDALERFDNISIVAPDTSANMASGFTEGDLWLRVTSGTTSNPLVGTIYVVVNKTWTIQSDTYIVDYRESFIFQTKQNYTGNKQVLSTPFLFYFGLTPQKTALDKLTKYFGPKGAFTSAE